MTINLECLVCKTRIPIEPVLLAQGKTFICPNCTSRVTLELKSIPVVKETIEKFEQLRARA
jgi:DNA-directed RNA polymerase subunit RPC12/RpoP